MSIQLIKAVARHARDGKISVQDERYIYRAFGKHIDKKKIQTTINYLRDGIVTRAEKEWLIGAFKLNSHQEHQLRKEIGTDGRGILRRQLWYFTRYLNRGYSSDTRIRACTTFSRHPDDLSHVRNRLWLHLKQETDPSVAAKCTRSYIATNGAQAVKAAVGSLYNPSATVRWKTAAVLSKGGAAVVDEVANVLMSSTVWRGTIPSPRGLAADILNLVGKPAVPKLLVALSHTDAWIRRLAAKALIGMGDPRALDKLIAATKDPDSRVRFHALIALQSYRDVKLVSVFERACDSKHWRIVREGVTGLRKFGKAAYPTLMKLLNRYRSDPKKNGLVEHVLISLGTIADPRSIPVLSREVSQGATPYIRRAAEESLVKIIKTGNVRSALLIKLLNRHRSDPKNHALIEYILTTLGKTADPRSIPILSKEINEGVTPHIRRIALTSLLNNLAAKTRAVLRPLFHKAKDRDIKEEIAEQLFLVSPESISENYIIALILKYLAGSRQSRAKEMLIRLSPAGAKRVMTTLLKKKAWAVAIAVLEHVWMQRSDSLNDVIARVVLETHQKAAVPFEVVRQAFLTTNDERLLKGLLTIMLKAGKWDPAEWREVAEAIAVRRTGWETRYVWHNPQMSLRDHYSKVYLRHAIPNKRCKIMAQLIWQLGLSTKVPTNVMMSACMGSADIQTMRKFMKVLFARKEWKAISAVTKFAFENWHPVMRNELAREVANIAASPSTPTALVADALIVAQYDNALVKKLFSTLVRRNAWKSLGRVVQLANRWWISHRSRSTLAQEVANIGNAPTALIAGACDLLRDGYTRYTSIKRRLFAQLLKRRAWKEINSVMRRLTMSYDLQVRWHDVDSNLYADMINVWASLYTVPTNILVLACKGSLQHRTIMALFKKVLLRKSWLDLQEVLIHACDCGHWNRRVITGIAERMVAHARTLGIPKELIKFLLVAKAQFVKSGTPLEAKIFKLLPNPCDRTMSMGCYR